MHLECASASIIFSMRMFTFYAWMGECRFVATSDRVAGWQGNGNIYIILLLQSRVSFLLSLNITINTVHFCNNAKFVCSNICYVQSEYRFRCTLNTTLLGASFPFHFSSYFLFDFSLFFSPNVCLHDCLQCSSNRKEGIQKARMQKVRNVQNFKTEPFE